MVGERTMQSQGRGAAGFGRETKTGSTAEQIIRSLLSEIGVAIDGPNRTDIHVRDVRFYERVLAEGSLGFGEAYMEGWWDCEDMVGLIRRIGKEDLKEKLKPSMRCLWGGLKARVVNLQSRHRAPIVARNHYDRTLDVYDNMTDKWTTLSCGYWKSAHTLDDAQEAKFDLICRKIGIHKHDRVLDIGCGLGSFARFASQKYGCAVVGINISPQQTRRALKLCEGLPVSILDCDYRDTEIYLQDGQFDKVVSIGMFEHVGYKNYQNYFKIVRRSLKDGGLFLLHTIGSNVSLIQNDPWVNKYIFPNGLLPSIKQIGAATEGLFVMEDWHNFGYDYSRTLKAWHENFVRSWTGSQHDPFFRMWTYYLLSFAGWFESRRIQLWQIILSNGGVAGGHTSIR